MALSPGFGVDGTGLLAAELGVSPGSSGCHVWRTADGGATWADAPPRTGPYGSCLQLLVAGAGATATALLHLSRGGVTRWMQSPDAGVTWEETEAPPAARPSASALLPAVRRAQTLFVGLPNGVWTFGPGTG